MPPAQLPPTPASSTDIRGKEKLVALAPALSLPPTAYTEPEDRAASLTPSNYGSDSSYHPASPTSPPKTQRKQPAVSQSRPTKADDGFALPPPPTRSRKIIQVKPKGSPADETAAAGEAGASSAKSAPAGGKGKRGKDGNTTAAGRKIARKTAHSLIERRRRSKMNEEFGVLKDMIPACNGQEMHKLAILQASIEYLRYLERCITDLKAANEDSKQPTSSPPPAHDLRMDAEPEAAGDAMDHDSDSDEAMSDDNNDDGEDASATPGSLSQVHSRTSLPSLASLPSMSQFTAPTASPSILPTAHHHQQHRHYSISSASQASYSPYIHSTQTSPFFGPSYGSQDPGAFALTSPALKAQDAASGASHRSHIQHLALSASEEAQRQHQHQHQQHQQQHQQRSREQDLDHEATAALLMLNSDRRSWTDKNGRGMSVRDLLS